MGSLYQARKSANPFNAVTPGNPGRPIVPLRTNESRCTDAFPHFPMIRRKSRLGIKATYHSVPDPDLEIGGGGGGCFRPFGPQFGLKLRWGAPLDSPLPFTLHNRNSGWKSHSTRHSVWEASERLCKLRKNDETKLILICTRRAYRLSRKTNGLSTLNRILSCCN